MEGGRGVGATAMEEQLQLLPRLLVTRTTSLTTSEVEGKFGGRSQGHLFKRPTSLVQRPRGGGKKRENIFVLSKALRI